MEGKNNSGKEKEQSSRQSYDPVSNLERSELLTMPSVKRSVAGEVRTEPSIKRTRLEGDVDDTQRAQRDTVAKKKRSSRQGGSTVSNRGGDEPLPTAQTVKRRAGASSQRKTPPKRRRLESDADDSQPAKQAATDKAKRKKKSDFPFDFGARDGTAKTKIVYSTVRADGLFNKSFGMNSSVTILKPSSDLAAKQEKFGFLVVIPVPYQDVYVRGADRHPITLIKKYIKAMTVTLGIKREDKELISAVSKRLKVVLCINTQYDFKKTAEEFEKKIKEMHAWVEGLNSQLTKFGWPGVLISAAWGANKPQSPAILSSAEEYGKLKEFIAQLHQDYPAYIEKVKGKKDLKARFPFGSMRTFAMGHPATQIAVNQLFKYNQQVMVLTGDADLVGLYPVNKQESIFNYYLDKLNKVDVSNSLPVRVGGAYKFELHEINRHLCQYSGALSHNSIVKSVLATYLAKTLDTAIRKIVAKFDAAYFCEPNTAINLTAFDKESLLVKPSNTSLLTNTTHDKLGGNPDWTQKLTGIFRQDKNWQDKKEKIQDFYAHMKAQLVSSSRHDLAIITVGEEEYNKVYKKRDELRQTIKTQILKSDAKGIDNMKLFGNHHNTQITSSQLNSRFNEAGYGPSVIYALIHGLEELLPYTFYMWHPGRKIKIYEVLGHVPAPTDIQLPEALPCNLGKGENKVDINALMQNLIEIMDLMSYKPTTYIVAFSGILLKERLSQEIKQKKLLDVFLQDPDKKKAFNSVALGEETWRDLLAMLVDAELLFRWGVGMLEYIKNIDDFVDGKLPDFLREGKKVDLEKMSKNAGLSGDLVLFSNGRSSAVNSKVNTAINLGGSDGNQISAPPQPPVDDLYYAYYGNYKWYFTHTPILRDGNCGFNTLQITRAEVVRVLYACRKNIHTRAYLAYEIRNVLMANIIPAEFETLYLRLSNGAQISLLTYWENLLAHFNNCQAKVDKVMRNINNELRLRGDVSQVLNQLHLNSQHAYHSELFLENRSYVQADQALNNFCQLEVVYTAYVNNYNNAGVWLGCNSALLFGDVTNILIYVWRVDAGRKLNFYMVNNVQQPNRIVNMLFTDGHTHFERLNFIRSEQLSHNVPSFNTSSSSTLYF